nr:HDOD domain-containing protein [uncultured Roseateles sp.]
MSQATLDQLYEAMRSTPGFVAVEKVATHILQALDGEGSSHREVASYVAEDFALTQKVLRLANSAMYAPFSSNAGSVVSALQVMGSDALLHLVLGTSVISEEDLQQDVSLSRTLLASELARSACAERASEASVATLMYDLGRQLMTKFLPAQAAQLDREMQAGAEVDAAARTVLGMTLQELGAEVARKWRLPASIVTTIDGTGDATLVGVARFANTASSLIYQGRADEVQRLVETLDLPGVDKARLGQLVQRRLESITPLPMAAPTAVPAAALNALLKSLQAAPPRTAEELSHAMFPVLSQTLGIAHCLLLMMTRSGEFRVRFAYGKGIDELRSKFTVSAELRPTAFHAVIKNNVDVAITDVARLSPSSLPEGYHELLPQVRKFIILPLATQRVYGLFYCDWDAESAIGAEDMAALRQLRNLFLPYLPKPEP